MNWQNRYEEEKMSEGIEIGQVVTIPKQGDQQECNNYLGRYNTAYKLLLTITQCRSKKEAEYQNRQI